ncbi:sperm-specific sodium:proton exchanger-like [Clavelina lepadiformis]|uniref:sperm-specific sodium:proton exchanger-like n=1 Tax=Clavelina lepadiformis TaxID=159417 RepID=UPI004041D83F
MANVTPTEGILACVTGNCTENGTMQYENVTSVSTSHHEHPPYQIVFIFGSCGVGAVLRILLRKWANFVSDWKWGSLLKIPYTVFLLLIGMVLEAIALAYPAEVQRYLLSEIDPELFLHVFLPVVIFESAYIIDIHVFWRSLGHVSLLAVPGLLIATMLTACLSLVLPEIGGLHDMQAKMYIALIFGAIISATDPVAVVALLKELGSQKYLGTIIEGEALLNDGAAIVVFKIFLELLKSTTPHFESLTALETFALVMQQSLLGPVIGWFLARIGSFILQKIYNDALAEITVTLSLTYITFYVGEICKTSGVLAVVTFGLALDRASITPAVDHFLHQFWEMLAYLANTLIFVIVGIIVVKHMDNMNIYDVGYMLVIYVCTTAIRALSIFSFFPFMKRLGLDLSWRHVLVMTWGGLRGAVGLALAIYLRSYEAILSPEVQSAGNRSSTYQSETSTGTQQGASDSQIDFEIIFEKILIHTGGIVLLTLVINASTIEAVLKKLGMLDVTHAQQVTMQNAVNRIQNNLKRSVGILKYDRFLADAKWNMVEDLTTVEYPYKNATCNDPEGDEENEGTIVEICHSQHATFKDLFEEARLRLIKALKMSYGKQYINGMLSDQEARVLIAAADTAADKPGEFINVENIRKNWKVRGTLPYIKGKLEDMMYSRKTTDLVPPRRRQLRKIFRLVTSAKFEIFMQCVIITNVVPIVLDFVVDETWENTEDWWLALQLVNIGFIIIYCIEVLLKLLGLGSKQFIKSRWNQFDILILIISFIEIIIDFTLIQSPLGPGNIVKTVKTTKVIKFGKITKVIRSLRATRLLRLSKTVLPRTLDFVNKLINMRLSFGYNVAKGFVAAEEEVSKLIISISENRNIQKKLMHASNNNRLTVTREMGLLQRDHPGIAISVKTRNAIRTILNNSRDAIQQLCSGGVLDETEMQLLERGVELRQKRLSNFPSTLAPPPPEDLLENIYWVKGNPKLLEFVKAHAVCMDYDYGDVIMEEDDVVDGIHIIVYGMIKLFGSLHGHIQQIRLRTDTFRNTLSAKQRNGDDDDDIPEANDEDFLGSGNIIGEMGLLTQSNRSCTITCETAVQTYFLSKEDLELAFGLFSKLKKAMWKVVAIRISAPLYLQHLEYQGTAIEQIHMHLSKGNIVELNETNPLFFISDDIIEVSIIYGEVKVPFTGEILKAPFVLHPEYEQLGIYNCNLAILLVIQREHLNVDTVASGLALKHNRGSRLPSISQVGGSLYGRKGSRAITTEELSEN